MKQSSPGSLPKSIQALKNCRVCGTNYGSEKIHLVDRTKTGTVAHITCPVCVHSALVFFGQTAHGLGFLGFMTDLNFTDAARFRDRPEISEAMVRAANKLLITDSHRVVSHLYYQSLLS